MQCPDQKPNRLPQPGLLPFSARGRCYLGNLGQNHRTPPGRLVSPSLWATIPRRIPNARELRVEQIRVILTSSKAR